MEAEDLRNRFKQDTGKTPYLKSTLEGFHVARREYANWLESKLQALKEEVEEKISRIQLVLDKGQSKHAFTSPQLEARISELKAVLNLITNLEDK